MYNNCNIQNVLINPRIEMVEGLFSLVFDYYNLQTKKIIEKGVSIPASYFGGFNQKFKTINYESIIGSGNITIKNSGNGVPGEDGKSAYDLAVDQGFVGNLQNYLDSLKGQDGKSVTITGNVVNVAALPTGLTNNDIGKGWITDNDGHLHVWGGNSFTDVGVIRGPQGIAGATGAQGLQGIQGIKGDQGEQGIQGIQGLQGIKGDIGPKGDKGDQGEQGIQGIQGIKGDSGASNWAEILDKPTDLVNTEILNETINIPQLAFSQFIETGQTILDPETNTQVQEVKIPLKSINGNDIIGIGDIQIAGGTGGGITSSDLEERLLEPGIDLDDNQFEQTGTTIVEGVTVPKISIKTSALGETITASSTGGGISVYNTKTGSNLSFNSFNNSDFELSTNVISLNAAYKASKQDTLVSGTNIKTIGGQSILGSGNFTLPSYVMSTATGTTSVNSLSSAFSINSTTRSTVTGWSAAVTAGKIYKIEVIATYQTAATTTGGSIGLILTDGGVGTIAGESRGSVSSTAVATELSIPLFAVNTSASTTGSFLTTTGVSVINTPHFINLKAIFTCSTTGTINIQWGSEVASSAAQLNIGSAFTITQIN